MDAEKVHELCFTLYRVRWLQGITLEEKMASVRRYFDENKDPSVGYEAWLLHNGFDGRIYKPIEEFIETHYRDGEYMRELITDPELWEEYKTQTGYTEG